MTTPADITFFMVGCQRCGTTWLDAALREHPEVYLPPQKQTYFFDSNYDKGVDWYLANFAGVRTMHKAVGEIANSYSLLRSIPPLARHFPHVKLIMSMRHPVDRAFSKFAKLSITGADSNAGSPLSFEEALESDPEILERGRYIEQIEALLQHYPRERLLLCLYDDFSADDRAFFRSVCRFIGIDETFETSQFGQKRNAASLPGAQRALHRVGLKPALNALSRSMVGDAVRRARKKSRTTGYGEMAPATRQRLCDYYRSYNARLARFIGRDLSAWDR